VRLEVFDLSGHRVRVVYAGLQPSGRFEFSWDGREEGGGVVPPGVYLYRLSVEAEKGGDQETGTVAVVY
jgi:flagellar hook assembly protein FlgD